MFYTENESLRDNQVMEYYKSVVKSWISRISITKILFSNIRTEIYITQ